MIKAKIYSKEVDNLITLDHNLERFLLCSSFSNNGVYNYSGELTDKIFFDQFYVGGGEHEKRLISEIFEMIKFGRKQSVFLLGNKGCGKTTFVHKIIESIKKSSEVRSICLDFGDASATLNLKKEKEILIQSIYKNFRNAIKKNNIDLLRSFIEIYKKNDDDFDVYWDYNNNLDSFYECLGGIINTGDNLLYNLKHTIRPKMADLEIFQLFLLLVLYDLAEQDFPEKQRTAIIFDNLDNLIDIADISEFVENFCNFQNGIDTLLKSISQHKKSKFNYTFIFVMRETTKANISPHSLETMRISSKEYDITTLFPKKDIILKRLYCYKNFLKNQESTKENSELIQQVDSILQIISDSYIHQTIFPFYNNDYRICVMKLIDICRRSPELIAQYRYLVSQKDENARFGGRGIIYRIILSDLQDKKYFKRLMIVNFKTRDQKTSLVRLLLTYLSNTTQSDCTDETPSVSLKELFKAFESIKPSEIIECLWAMFDLITTNDWNHLITFSSSKSASKERLYKEKEIYRKDDFTGSDKEFSRFRITCAGQIYLSNICTHYEFFSCRALGNNYLPLFCKENLVMNNGRYVFEDIIDAVYSQVCSCCQELQKSFEGDNGLCREAKPPYNYRNDSIYQYHSERMIFSHIGYLDSFRCFILKTYTNFPKKDIDIKTISDIILKAIDNYCKLISDKKIAKCAATKRFGEISLNLEEAKKCPTDPTKTINRK